MKTCFEAVRPSEFGNSGKDDLVHDVDEIRMSGCRSANTHGVSPYPAAASEGPLGELSGVVCLVELYGQCDYVACFGAC